MPALILANSTDRLTKPVASQYMKKHILNSQLEVVKPGNHQGLIERYEQVNEAAKRFIHSLG